MSDTNSRRLRTAEAAAYLGLSPRTLEKQRLDGSGPPFIKLNRTVVYCTATLDSFLAARERRSTADPGPAPQVAV